MNMVQMDCKVQNMSLAKFGGGGSVEGTIAGTKSQSWDRPVRRGSAN